LASGAGGAAARALGGDGLATLLAVLSRSNGALEALSLRRVPLSAAQAAACVACLRLKPGLGLDLEGCLGTGVGGRLRASIQRNLRRAQILEVANCCPCIHVSPLSVFLCRLSASLRLVCAARALKRRLLCCAFACWTSGERARA
jgi:hypothetical protein